MEVTFKKFELRERINDNLNVQLSEEEAIKIAKNFSSINSKKEDFIRVSNLDFGDFSIINPQKRTRTSTYLTNNIFMNYHDSSPDWKDYPKRKHSLIFANFEAMMFGNIMYYVVPLDKMFNLPIATTQSHDFNWTKLDYENIKGKEVNYYIDKYLTPDEGAKYFRSKKPLDFKKITPEALEFTLFEYKDFTAVKDFKNRDKSFGNKREFYTEMPCMLIKQKGHNEVYIDAYRKIKNV